MFQYKNYLYKNINYTIFRYWSNTLSCLTKIIVLYRFVISAILLLKWNFYKSEQKIFLKRDNQPNKKRKHPSLHRMSGNICNDWLGFRRNALNCFNQKSLFQYYLYWKKIKEVFYFILLNFNGMRRKWIIKWKYFVESKSLLIILILEVN